MANAIAVVCAFAILAGVGIVVALVVLSDTENFWWEEDDDFDTKI